MPKITSDDVAVLSEIALEEIERTERTGLPLDDIFIDETSAFLHERWLETNAPAPFSEDDRPYGLLEQSEKEKYHIIVQKAIGAYDAAIKRASA